MNHLGVIIAVRDDPIRPFQVDLDLGDGALELGWTMCSLGAWATVIFSDDLIGAQVTVWDTGYTNSQDKYRISEIWPNLKTPLEPNRKRLARRGDPVGIRGNPKITPLAAATILTAIPPILPLSHDLIGTITDG